MKINFKIIRLGGDGQQGRKCHVPSVKAFAPEAGMARQDFISICSDTLSSQGLSQVWYGKLVEWLGQVV